jgi:hypothetical protein
MSETTNPKLESSSESVEHGQKPHHEEMEEYAGGYLKAYHGRIDTWLLVVYAVLFAWALYYLFAFWGGLGPGLDIRQ